MRPLEPITDEERAYVFDLVKSSRQFAEDTWEYFKEQGWDKEVCNSMTQTSLMFCALGLLDKNLRDSFADINDTLKCIATSLEEHRK